MVTDEGSDIDCNICNFILHGPRLWPGGPIEQEWKRLIGDPYIIGHYNPSAGIIDLVSHTTYVVCVNFIHKWQNIQFQVDSELQIF